MFCFRIGTFFRGGKNFKQYLGTDSFCCLVDFRTIASTERKEKKMAATRRNYSLPVLSPFHLISRRGTRENRIAMYHSKETIHVVWHN